MATAETTEESTLLFYASHIRPLNRQQISNRRLQLFNLLNGDLFYPLNIWPKDIKALFWKKPIGDCDTFKLLLFFIGNGCSPCIIAEWILTSQNWAPQSKGEKRARQIDFVKANLGSKSDRWFYFDIHHEEWLYLSGEKRECNID